MKHSKICFLFFIFFVVTNVIRTNVNFIRKINSLIVWFVQYPLLCTSIIYMGLFFIKSSRKVFLRDGFFVLPTLLFTLYIIGKIIFTF
jgi:hypothetical protein